MVNRQTRNPGEIRRFDETARIREAPSYAVDTGEGWRALSTVAGQLSSKLSGLADEAAAREGAAAGLAAGASSGAAYLRMQAAQAGAAGKNNRSAAAAILRKEEGFRDTPYWDVNAFRTGYGSDTVTAPDGSVSRVTKNTKVSREDAERDLARRLDEFAARASQQTGGAFDQLPENVKAALLSVTYNYGSLPKSVVAAVRQGDVETIAGAVGSLGANSSRRQREAAIIRGAAVPDAETARQAGASPQPAVPVLPSQPLALRRDGTIYGEAYDRSAASAYSWRMQTGLEAQLQQAYEASSDDPGALAASFAKIHDEYGKDPNLADPELKEAFTKRFVERSQAYMLDAQAKATTRMRQEETIAVGEGIEAQRLGIERQAIALGANAQGDAILGREVARAGRSIDAAVKAGSISPAAGAKAKSDLAETAATARVRGVYSALDTPEKKEEFATALLDDWTAGKGPLAKLPFATVKALSTTLWSEARADINRKTAAQKVEAARLEQLVKDDVVSVGVTGKGLEPGESGLDPKKVMALLGPEKFEAWRADRAAAERTWQATSGMETETAEEIAQRLAVLAPKSGTPGYAESLKVFNAATKKADDLIKKRAADPAAAADASFPQVKAVAAAADPTNPDSMQALVAARLQAQEALGIPELGRQPLTQKEALSLARAVTAQPDPAKQSRAMGQLVEQVQAAYGPHAEPVLSQILHVRGVDKEMANFGAGLFSRLNLGSGATPGERRQGGVLSETGAADEAGKPRPDDAFSVPNYKQQQMLLEHPDLAPKFDEKFGPGASTQILGKRQQGTTRKEDGGTASVGADGESWAPDR